MSNRIESKVSKTAQGTALMRATSYYEKDSYYKSEDFIAPMILPSYFKTIAKFDVLRTLLKKALFKVPGIYEYVISRTKFIDEIFSDVTTGIEQVLIFGAGFDSRAIRFKNELKNANVFELDAPVTQQAKISMFTKKSIRFTSNLTFIAIDFTKESLAEKLNEAGFQNNRRCLFLLEGLTYYLTPEAIESTFSLISNYSAQGSLLVFDYASVSNDRQETIDNDTKKHYQSLDKAGERPGFMLEGQIQDFLAQYEFELKEEVDSIQLAKKYFDKADFEPAAQKFRIVKAIKRI
jgi:methyltransferase (TIGR00027 family)